ncbi:MAG: antibiotic acetyltransferase [Bacillota bacterium]
MLFKKCKIKNSCVGKNSHIDKNSTVEDSTIGNKCIVNNAEIYNSILGDYSTVNRHSVMWNTKVGKFCSIGGGVKINLSNHPVDYFSSHPLFYRKNYEGNNIDENLFVESKTCIIGDDVWLGENVLVMGGVNIGTGAIIGACSFVNKDIPPYAIACGVPAKVLKYRFSEGIIVQLQKINWCDISEDLLYEFIDLIKNDNTILSDIDKTIVTIKKLMQL